MKHELDQAFPNNVHSEDFLDSTFNAYERRLSHAYEEVLQSMGSLDFGVWMKVLVPFVAGITVRHPDFLGNPPTQIMIQTSRLFEMTRLLAPLMVAGWYFVTPPSGKAFIVSDSGFVTAIDKGTNTPGLFVPIGSSAGLAIWAMQARGIARQTDGMWTTPLPHKELTADEVEMLNASMARSAPQWIAAAKAANINVVFEPTSPPYVSPFVGWPNRGSLGTHDRAYDFALQLAGLGRTAEDWKPMGIMSSVVPNVRMVQDAGSNVIIAALELPDAST